jgi:AbrB family looped-hinge helix DNA binding protein
MEVALTKMSSKGQIVVPADMRKEFREGDKLVIIKVKDRLVLKKITALDKALAEDLEFARRTEEAYQRYKKGKFKSMPAEQFLKELAKW